MVNLTFLGISKKISKSLNGNIKIIQLYWRSYRLFLKLHKFRQLRLCIYLIKVSVEFCWLPKSSYNFFELNVETVDLELLLKWCLKFMVWKWWSLTTNMKFMNANLSMICLKMILMVDQTFFYCSRDWKKIYLILVIFFFVILTNWFNFLRKGIFDEFFSIIFNNIKKEFFF